MGKALESFKKALFHAQEKYGAQTELHKKTGLSRTVLKAYIDGKTEPGLGAIEKIADALEVPAFYLLMNPTERARWDSSASAPSLERRVTALEEREPHLPSLPAEIWDAINGDEVDLQALRVILRAHFELKSSKG